MDNKILNIFAETINEAMISVIISNSTDKDLVTKIKIRPVMIKGELCFQASEFRGEKVFHSNYTKEELLNKLPVWFEGLFRQAEIKTRNGQATVLVSKKGKATVNYKKENHKENEHNNHKDEHINHNNQEPHKDSMNKTGITNMEMNIEGVDYSHNKKKNYILEEGNVLPFLVDLGVMTPEGMVVKAKSDKFRQINRFLEYIEDILQYLDKGRELTILDFGCGKSYLTFAMYYYLKLQKGYQINVIGLDLKKDVILHCNKLSKKYGYDKLQFLQGDIASYQGTEQVDMVVTLHACDTATDYALFKAVNWGAKVILSVPCCQHELNKQIHNDVLQPILKYGIIKERMSALITDALRAELLETLGYRVQLLEFIDMEHTPKNILIRAVKRRNRVSDNSGNDQKIKDCIKFLGVSPSLESLIENAKLKEGN